MAKRKQSNYARYRELCDEDVKMPGNKDDTQFGPEYLILNTSTFTVSLLREYRGYLTYNTNLDRFELFIRYDDRGTRYMIQKTSKVEGNFSRIMEHPDIMVVIVEKTLNIKEVSNVRKQKLQD